MDIFPSCQSEESRIDSEGIWTESRIGFPRAQMCAFHTITMVSRSPGNHTSLDRGITKGQTSCITSLAPGIRVENQVEGSAARQLLDRCKDWNRQ